MKKKVEYRWEWFTEQDKDTGYIEAGYRFVPVKKSKNQEG